MPPPAMPNAMRTTNESSGQQQKATPAAAAPAASSCSSGGEVGENDMVQAQPQAGRRQPLARDCASTNLNLNHVSINLQVRTGAGWDDG